MPNQAAKIPDWLRGVIYQIYLRSFYDTNGDGIGDLRGVLKKLDYLHWLGISGIWLTPFYPSPMLDSGYDATDFTDINPLFGSLADFDDLLAAAHAKGIRVIVDFVPNHTSIDHRWFAESRSSRTHRRRDWYIWRDAAKNGGPPNNWMNEFGQSAWEYDAATAQYYLHSFLKEQPDLNWSNADVRAEMSNIMRFWLQRGADGLRIDALPWMAKDPLLRNHPLNPDFSESENPSHRITPTFAQDQPQLEEYVREMRAVVDDFPERVLIGEIRLPPQRFPFYYNAGLHFPFNYQLSGSDWNALTLRKAIDQTEGLLNREHWPNWFLGTHDEPRVATRLGQEMVPLAAMLALTLRGTGVVYYGEEIGLENGTIPHDQITDYYDKLLPGYGLGRDAQRTPMPWSAQLNAGFTEGAPWLPVNEDYLTRNVACQRERSESLLQLYRHLIHLRKLPAFRKGDYIPDMQDKCTFAFVRQVKSESYLIGLNFSNESISLLSDNACGTIFLSTTLRRKDERIQRKINLAPYEGVILKIK